MESGQALLQTGIDAFFSRSGLSPDHQRDCYSFAEHLYPGSRIYPSTCQGYCSLTLFVDDEVVLQFRPHQYRLDLTITTIARQVYGSRAPDTRYIAKHSTSSLLVYSMNRVAGVSLRDFKSGCTLSTEQLTKLCSDFARFVARGWHGRHVQGVPLGMVGKSIRSRVSMLNAKLPRRFLATARRVWEQLHSIEALPWVLTHGDIVSGNVMVDPVSSHIVGLVDWAEAEVLPFGICFYGLEEFLGELTSSGFRYRQDACHLRDTFWAELKSEIPSLGQDEFLKTVRLARDLGVLLWHGIAFDEGAINRVVVEGRDIEEIHRLDAYLFEAVDQPWKRISKM